MNPALATLIDVDALAHVAVVAFAATCGLVFAFGTGVLALERIGAARESSRGTPPAWAAALFCAALGSVAILALGAWAMTQKS